MTSALTTLSLDCASPGAVGWPDGVVPAALGAYAAMTGAFTFMEFAEFRPMVYLESTTSCLFLEKPAEIGAYRGILAVLTDTALNERESRELIATLATELSPDREES
jgi:Domain of unknown function (DUF5753)